MLFIAFYIAAQINISDVHINLNKITYIYIYAKRLTITFRLDIFISMCGPWESNPQPFALLTQCSTTEPHRNIQTYAILIVCLLSYIIYSCCCQVYFCCVKDLTCMLWLKLFVCDVTASLFLSCQVFIPILIHISKRIYFHFYLSIYTLGGRGTL